MTNILCFPDTASLSSVMISCNRMATFNVSLLNKLGDCMTDLFPEFCVVADPAAWGAAHFLLLWCLWFLVLCLDAVQLRRTALVR
jgi:hypothetical protein